MEIPKERLEVLFVDDSPEDLEFFSSLLKESSAGHKIMTASSPNEALRISRDNNLDCIVIDFNMPEQNGLELLDQLSDNKNPSVATLIMTGQPNQTIQADAARKGAYNFIVKDINLTSEELEAIVIKCVKMARSLANS